MLNARNTVLVYPDPKPTIEHGVIQTTKTYGVCRVEPRAGDVVVVAVSLSINSQMYGKKDLKELAHELTKIAGHMEDEKC